VSAIVECPKCGAVAVVDGDPLSLKHADDCPARADWDRLQEIHDSTGTEAVYVVMPSEAIAAAAFQRIEETTELISVWRFTTSDRSRWAIVAMGEEAQRAQVARARRTLEAAGGIRQDFPGDLVNALRERRWRSSLKGAVKAIEEGRDPAGEVRHTRTRWNAGARLSPDGTMSPARRPQG
jgi:hypothetical protein